MKAKEKAKSLYFYYENLLDPFMLISDASETFIKEKLKQCALICVEEIIETYHPEHQLGFWQEVKQEIELL